MKKYNQSSFFSIFYKTSKPKEDDESLKIYTEETFQQFIGIPKKANMHTFDILKIINPQSNTEYEKLDVDLVLSVHSPSKEGIKIYRRLWDYENISQIFDQKPFHLDYQLLLNDFSQRNCVKQTQKQQQFFGFIFVYTLDANFEIYGKLQKKNKKGIYVDTRGYLSQQYFGFYNENKMKLKLSNLDSIKVFVWDDQTKFTFKILNNRKLYFFKANKKSDFVYWLQNIERYLNCAHFRNKLISQENDIIECSRTQINKMEELVQQKLQNEQFSDKYLVNLKNQIRNCLDINLIQFLIDQSSITADQIDKQIKSDQFEFINPNENTDRLKYYQFIEYPFKFESNELEKQLIQVKKRIIDHYSDFIKLSQIEDSIIQEPRIKLKSVLQEFKPNFDAFYS